jgi:hypothetical protein
MVDRPLAAVGLKRRVALRIPFFIPAVFAIAQTDFTIPSSEAWLR